MSKETILIFGGDGKIAKSIVKKYLNENCFVIAVDKKDDTDSVNFKQNPDYKYYSCDVTNINDLSNLYNIFSNENICVSHIISAAGAPFSSEMNGILGIDFQDIDQSIKLNLNSHLYIAKIFLPLLIKNERKNQSFTMVSSVNGIKSFDLPAYSAAKSGILGLMYAIVRELGDKHIRVNTIIPGTVATKEEISNQYYNYKYKEMMALKQFTYPEDIADAAFAISHIMKAVTGQSLVVDSGQIV